MEKLIVEQENRAGQEFSLERPVVSIGRGADNDICLREQGVSRHHARLQRNPQGWLLTDLGSTNGTYVNGQRMPGHEAYLLRSGDRVRIGGSLLFVQHGKGSEPEDAPQRGFVKRGAATSQEESASARGRENRPASRHKGSLHPIVLIVGAVGLIVVLAAIVFLLVTSLRPPEALPTATAVDPMEHMMTALPLPTGLEDIVTAVVPLVPTGLSIPWLGGTPTPTP